VPTTYLVALFLQVGKWKYNQLEGGWKRQDCFLAGVHTLPVGSIPGLICEKSLIHEKQIMCDVCMYLMGILVLELNCVSLIPKTAKLVGQFSTWWFFFSFVRWNKSRNWCRFDWMHCFGFLSILSLGFVCTRLCLSKWQLVMNYVSRIFLVSCFFPPNHWSENASTKLMCTDTRVKNVVLPTSTVKLTKKTAGCILSYFTAGCKIATPLIYF
jgi:hypothetical protein